MNVIVEILEYTEKCKVYKMKHNPIDILQNKHFYRLFQGFPLHQLLYYVLQECDS